MNKNNIFEHVLYEMQMYHFTYQKLLTYKNSNAWEEQVLFNAFWDSHLLHLRNLIDFFNNEEHCINVNFLLNSGNDSFRVPNDSNENKRIINKSCDHLTKERFEISDLHIRQLKLVNTMYPIVSEQIRQWLNYIQSTNDLKTDFIINREDSMNMICELKKAIKGEKK